MIERTNEKGLAAKLSLRDFLGSGDRIRTCDLRVMSLLPDLKNKNTKRLDRRAFPLFSDGCMIFRPHPNKQNPFNECNSNEPKRHKSDTLERLLPASRPWCSITPPQQEPLCSIATHFQTLRYIPSSTLSVQ